MLNIGMEQQVQVRGSDGSILWTGGVQPGSTYIAISSEASTAVKMGEAVLWDPAAGKGFLPRSETTAAAGTPSTDLPLSLAIYCKRTSAGAGDKGFLGVAAEPIAAGKRGLILSTGSLCTVITTTAALVVGDFVGSSATAGALAAQTTRTTALNCGHVLKINTGTPASPGAGTGDTGWAGIMVQPG